MKQMVIHVKIQPEKPDILSVPYLLVAILNYAATSYQGGLPTCSRWILKISRPAL